MQLTKLQPPFFSTGLWHLGQGFVCTVIQLTVSDSSRHFLVHSFHIKHEQGECASDTQLKQNCKPQEHSTSQNSSFSTLIAFPQWGILGHHLTILLSSMYDSRRNRSNFAARSGCLVLTSFLTIASSQIALHLWAIHLIRLLCPSLILTMKCSVQPDKPNTKELILCHILLFHAKVKLLNGETTMREWNYVSEKRYCKMLNEPISNLLQPYNDTRDRRTCFN